MALSNLFGWKKKAETENSAACGTACGGAGKPEGSNRPVDDCSERTGAERRHSNRSSPAGLEHSRNLLST